MFNTGAMLPFVPVDPLERLRQEFGIRDSATQGAVNDAAPPLDLVDRPSVPNTQGSPEEKEGFDWGNLLAQLSSGLARGASIYGSQDPGRTLAAFLQQDKQQELAREKMDREYEYKQEQLEWMRERLEKTMSHEDEVREDSQEHDQEMWRLKFKDKKSLLDEQNKDTLEQIAARGSVQMDLLDKRTEAQLEAQKIDHRQILSRQRELFGLKSQAGQQQSINEMAAKYKTTIPELSTEEARAYAQWYYTGEGSEDGLEDALGKVTTFHQRQSAMKDYEALSSLIQTDSLTGQPLNTPANQATMATAQRVGMIVADNIAKRYEPEMQQWTKGEGRSKLTGTLDAIQAGDLTFEEAISKVEKSPRLAPEQKEWFITSLQAAADAAMPEEDTDDSEVLSTARQGSYSGRF